MEEICCFGAGGDTIRLWLAVVGFVCSGAGGRETANLTRVHIIERVNRVVVLL